MKQISDVVTDGFRRSCVAQNSIYSTVESASMQPARRAQKSNPSEITGFERAVEMIGKIESFADSAQVVRECEPSCLPPVRAGRRAAWQPRASSYPTNEFRDYPESQHRL